MGDAAFCCTPEAGDGDTAHPAPQTGLLNCVPRSCWQSGGGVNWVVSGPRLVHVVCEERVLDAGVGVGVAALKLTL